MTQSNRARRLAVVTAAALAIGTWGAVSSVAADERPARPGPSATPDKLDKRAHSAASTSGRERSRAFPSARGADAGRAAYFVRLKGPGAADLSEKAGGGQRGMSTAKVRRGQVRRMAAGVLGTARSADRGAAALYTVSNAIPGTGLLLDRAGVKAVTADPNVAEVTRLVRKTAELSSVDSLVKAVNVWRFAGNTGKGVTIGIIDTGVDYTHADFGGVGTMAAFDKAHANETSRSWYQDLPQRARTKFAGGYDFAGDSYDGDGEAGSPIPQPDNNPLDCNGHGSHVAGIAAGYGVDKGKPLKNKKYRKLKAKKLAKLDIGPGMAPGARIYALRVFGCEGSSYLDIPALDRALDPDGNGDFSDHLDIVNASLGSDYGPQDDPSLDVVNEIAAHGVLPAMSIGNNGDLTDVGGTPGSATASIASASSVDKLDLLDQIRVNGPANVAGTKIGQMSVAYDWVRNGPTRAPVTGQVVQLAGSSNDDGCAPPVADPDNELAPDPASWAGVAGKVAWLEWDDSDATRRCGSVVRAQNAQAAGAIGALFTSQLETFSAGITGDPDIPVFQMTKSVTDQLRPAAAAGTLNVTFDGRLQASFPRVTPAQTDTISSFTSRGPHGSLGVVKPDVSAPGDTIGSAGVGSGDRVAVNSGTSMASPATAGIAALVKSRHPKWSPLKVKAAIMNTARHDLWTGPGRKGTRYGPARVGAGRVDAKAAVTTRLLAWTQGPNNPVSASFGVVPAPINGGTVTRTKKVQVENLNKKPVDVKVSYQSLVSQPGVSYSVSPSKLTVKAKDSKTFTVTMTVNPTALRHTKDPTMETDQVGVPRQFVSDSSGRLLVKQKGRKANRVPVYSAAKPTSSTTATLQGNDMVVSGAGFDSGDSPSDWTSLLNVSEFGASSPVLPPCASPDALPVDCATTATDRGGDIQHVGAGANADYLWFSMSTHSDFTNLAINSPEFYYDTDGDLETAEFLTYVTFIEATDVYVAETENLVTGEVDQQPINFNFGDVDTNIFDNSVVVLPVDKAFLGLVGSGSQPIVYEAETYNWWHGVWTDATDPVEFDAGLPTVTTAAPLYVDNGGTTIPLTGSRANAAQALVLHLHGAKGARAQVIDVPGVE